MSFCLMSFTIAAFLLSIIMNVSTAPVALAFAANTTELSRRTTHNGRGTWFEPGLGNCGKWNDQGDPIVAISTQIYGEGANCNQWVHITNTANGKTTWAMVRDSCPSCAPGSLDMSPHTFSQLDSLDTGVIPIQWHYEPRGFSP